MHYTGKEPSNLSSTFNAMEHTGDFTRTSECAYVGGYRADFVLQIGDTGQENC